MRLQCLKMSYTKVLRSHYSYYVNELIVDEFPVTDFVGMKIHQVDAEAVRKKEGPEMTYINTRMWGDYHGGRDEDAEQEGDDYGQQNEEKAANEREAREKKKAEMKDAWEYFCLQVF